MRVTELDKHCATELKLLRKSHNIKQLIMVEYLNLDTQQQYSDLENGKKHFTDALILKICSLFHISILEFVNDQTKTDNLSVILNPDDYTIIETIKDSDIKLMLYKKLFLESKIENIETKLRLLYKEFDPKTMIPTKHRIHVMI
jgi:transcriptional regulator with XRE-family HTH domain